ncbi:abortive phage infection protein [Oscillatoriales cyanobacterium USR001]|nr:abortive phage infection protein [Oscillatoriales cyanobacterium USR001]
MTEKPLFFNIANIIKRSILIILSVLAIAIVGLSLIASLNQPQIQSELELSQTNLLLHAAEWQEENSPNSSLETARIALIGEEPFKAALNQYQEAENSAQLSIKNKFQELKNPELDPLKRQQLQIEILLLEKSSAELGVKLGLLQIQNGKTEAALKTWQDIIKIDQPKTVTLPSVEKAKILLSLWRNPPELSPEIEVKIQKYLDGWFRYKSLNQLYQLQQRLPELESLQASEQIIAEQAIEKLLLVTGIPGFGLLIGSGLMIFLGIQWLLTFKQSDPENPSAGPILMRNSSLAWETPWGGETIWEVLIFGFFFVGQILIPLLLPISFAFLHINPASFDARNKAFYILVNYLLLAGGGLGTLYLCLRPFLPLPEGWFRVKLGGNWFLWGVGGYLVAVPLVLFVSLLNQQIWHGNGGSNPILPIALENNDSIALAVFFGTASIAAPIFEEIMFRGFLLSSLTRYLPVWGAILVSGFVFAIAHLNISEVLPLAILGIVLGFVYTRSRNLLASMLVHSLWNSVTLLSLFLLGSDG